MALRLPGQGGARLQTGLDTLDYELAGEMAASLGRAGNRVASAMAALNAHNARDAERVLLVKAAAGAVHAYFIQRELIGLRRHHDAIRDYGIPEEVLARLGAS
jgi:NADPH-dependent curcumin reductase CurA